MAYSVFAKYYDRLTQNISYADRAVYFDTIIKQNMPNACLLLDLACGTGSLSVELSRKGYDVIGVDGSADMLCYAMEKNSQLSCDILYLCQDMEELDLYGTIQVAICALDSLNHVTDPKKLQKIFQKVSLFLEPEGLFIFDVNTPYKHQHILGDNSFIYEYDDVYCVWQNQTEKGSFLTNISLDFFEYEDGAYYRTAEHFSERAYQGDELAVFIQNAGLDILHIYGEDSFLPPEENCQRLVYVLKKRGT